MDEPTETLHAMNTWTQTLRKRIIMDYYYYCIIIFLAVVVVVVVVVIKVAAFKVLILNNPCYFYM